MGHKDNTKPGSLLEDSYDLYSLWTNYYIILEYVYEINSCITMRVDKMGCIYFTVFAFILGTISPCTTGFKALCDPSDFTSTVKLSKY